MSQLTSFFSQLEDIFVLNHMMLEDVTHNFNIVQFQYFLVLFD